MADQLGSIETIFSEKLYMSTEELFDANKLNVEYVKKGKTTFTLSITDSKTNLVHLRLKSKVIERKCDCVFFDKSKECTHVLYALLHLRRDLNDKNSELSIKASKPRKSSSNPSSLNTRTILNEIPIELLSDFVKAYSAKDASFRLALKTYFANQIDLEDNFEKYGSLFTTVVLPKTHRHEQMTVSEKKDFHRLLESLIDTAKDSIALEQYREAMYILLQCFDKIFYVRKNYTNAATRLEKQESEFLEILKQLTGSGIPPELLSEMKTKILDLTTRSYFIPAKNNPLALLIELGMIEKTELDEQINVFIGKAKERNEHAPFFLDLSILTFQINDKYLDLLLENLALSKIIDRIISMDYDQFPDFPLLISEHLINSNRSNKRLDHFYVIKLMEAEKLDLAFDAMKSFHEKHKDISHSLRQIKLMDDDSRFNNKERIIAIFDDLEVSGKLKLLEELDEVKLLANILKEEPNLELLWKYDAMIGEYDEDLLSEIYTMTMSKHLNEFIGPQGTQSLNDSLLRLNSYGFKKIALGLKKSMKEEFDHRKNLTDNLISVR